MKRIPFFLILFVISGIAKSQQFKIYKFDKEFISQNKKPSVIFFCATWCFPCMKKFIPVIDSLQNNATYNFHVVMDQGGYKKIIPIILEHKYHDSLIELLSGKYYPQLNKLISINVSGKIFKNLANEIDSIYHIGKEKEKVWVGGAIIYSKEKILLTGFDHTAEELIKIIKDKLKEFQPETIMKDASAQ